MTGHPYPDQWTPTTSERQYRRPQVGQELGWRYAVWQVVEVRPVDDVDLTAEQAADLAIWRPEFRERWRPYHLVLAHRRGPLLVDPQVRQRLHDGTTTVHIAVGRPAQTYGWKVMAEHYAVCVCHGDPHPCGDLQAARYAAEAARRTSTLLDRHDPGVCFACQGPIGPRTVTVTFPGTSPLVPGAPAPTFHARRWSCWMEARRYELHHRVASDPAVHRLASCPGALFIHTGDGRAECTAELACTGHHGPQVRGGNPAASLDCTTYHHLASNTGYYPRPPTPCADPACLGRDTSTGGPDPLAVGDLLADGRRRLIVGGSYDTPGGDL